MPNEITRDELINLLGRGYWIETQFEEASQWSAYITSLSERGREIVFAIIRDSTRHRILLEELGKKLGVDLKSLLKDYEKRKFDFGKMKEDEIFKVILEHEIVVKDLYTRLKHHISDDILKESDLSAKEFHRAMDVLIADEEKHIRMVEPHSDKTVRIL